MSRTPNGIAIFVVSNSQVDCAMEIFRVFRGRRLTLTQGHANDEARTKSLH